MEEWRQRDRGRGTLATAGAEGRQLFVELGELFLTSIIPERHTAFSFFFPNPVELICLFALYF